MFYVFNALFLLLRERSIFLRIPCHVFPPYFIISTILNVFLGNIFYLLTYQRFKKIKRAGSTRAPCFFFNKRTSNAFLLFDTESNTNGKSVEVQLKKMIYLSWRPLFFTVDFLSFDDNLSWPVSLSVAF